MGLVETVKFDKMSLGLRTAYLVDNQDKFQSIVDERLKELEEKLDELGEDNEPITPDTGGDQ